MPLPGSFNSQNVNNTFQPNNSNKDTNNNGNNNNCNINTTHMLVGPNGEPRKPIKTTLGIVPPNHVFSRFSHDSSSSKPSHFLSNNYSSRPLITNENNSIHNFESNRIGKIYHGLQNTGNTCYLNSLLQVLFFSPQFSDLIASLDSQLQNFRYTSIQNSSTSYDDFARLAFALAELFSTMRKQIKEEPSKQLFGLFQLGSSHQNYTHGISITPTGFLDSTSRIDSRFSSFSEQQDAQEFFTFLLSNFEDGVISTINMLKNKHIYYLMNTNTNQNDEKHQNNENEMMNDPLHSILSMTQEELQEQDNIADEDFLEHLRKRKRTETEDFQNDSNLSESSLNDTNKKPKLFESEEDGVLYHQNIINMNESVPEGHHASLTSNHQNHQSTSDSSFQSNPYDFQSNINSSNHIISMNGDHSLNLRLSISGEIESENFATVNNNSSHHDDHNNNRMEMDMPVAEQQQESFEKNAPNFETISSPSNLFKAIISSTVQCMECENESSRKEHYFDVSLSIEKSKDLYWSINEFLCKSHLKSTEKYYCDNCRHHCEAWKYTRFDELPEILTIHLKRFSFDGSNDFAALGNYRASKLSFNIDCPDIFDVPLSWMSSEAQQKFFESSDSSFLKSSRSRVRHPGKEYTSCAKYQVYAIIFHSGISTSHGHYTSATKIPENQNPQIGAEWLLFDDHHVSYLSHDTILKLLSESSSSISTPYMIFYKKMT